MIDLFAKSEHPVFVFEGPDGAGKTTLAKHLAKVTGAKYIHLTYRFKDRMHLYHSAAIKLVARYAQHQPVVLDRWWPSEILYAECYRGGSKFMKHFFLLEHIATQMGVTYVWCLPEDKKRYFDNINRLKDNREELFQDGFDRLYDLYRDFYHQYGGLRENAVHYDMFKNFVGDDINEAVRDMTFDYISQNILEFAEDYRSTLP